MLCLHWRQPQTGYPGSLLSYPAHTQHTGRKPTRRTCVRESRLVQDEQLRVRLCPVRVRKEQQLSFPPRCNVHRPDAFQRPQACMACASLCDCTFRVLRIFSSSSWTHASRLFDSTLIPTAYSSHLFSGPSCPPAALNCPLRRGRRRETTTAEYCRSRWTAPQARQRPFPPSFKLRSPVSSATSVNMYWAEGTSKATDVDYHEPVLSNEQQFLPSAKVVVNIK